MIVELNEQIELNSLFEKEIEKAICTTISGLIFTCKTCEIDIPEIIRIQVFAGNLNNRSSQDKLFSIVIDCLE